MIKHDALLLISVIFSFTQSIYSFVYFLSPIIGLVIQPIIGVMSDRCESRFGRRRPFVLLLCMVGFIGISLVLNANILGGLLGDKNREIPIISIILVGIGVTLLDFSADSADSPLRALILDVCNSKDQDTGLNINSFLGGTGSAFGYIVTAIDWNKILVDSIGLIFSFRKFSNDVQFYNFFINFSVR
jgi:solute carrier family 45 protein 1/2/4